MDIKICENKSCFGLVVGGNKETERKKSLSQYIALTENSVFFIKRTGCGVACGSKTLINEKCV